MYLRRMQGRVLVHAATDSELLDPSGPRNKREQRLVACSYSDFPRRDSFD